MFFIFIWGGGHNKLTFLFADLNFHNADYRTCINTVNNTASYSSKYIIHMISKMIFQYTYIIEMMQNLH